MLLVRNAIHDIDFHYTRRRIFHLEFGSGHAKACGHKAISPKMVRPTWYFNSTSSKNSYQNFPLETQYKIWLPEDSINSPREFKLKQDLGP